jgi:phenylalanyl-tRNA synthetase beta chain
MKVPVSWLREYFGSALDPYEAAERLTLSGVEVEQVQAIGALDPLVVVAEIVSERAVKGAAGAREFEIRADRARRLVSTVTSLAVGQKVAVALPGATLFSADLKELVEVSATELYGVSSEAVLVSAAALGIGANVSDPIALADSATPGAKLLDVVGAQADSEADLVLHLAILPNIARCQSMAGVAREVSALLQLELKAPASPPGYSAAKKLAPTISAPDAASVLGVTLLENVEVKRSPRWLERRLILGGMTPINNVVDASNYVMLELGQPTHPYDAERLPSLDLGVGRSRAGDRLLTLQQDEGQEPMLVPEGVPLIVSNDQPVAVAGVIGGRATSISSGTKTVLLEAAAFDYVAIRRSQQAAKIYSEASARFSRGVNPELPGLAARRFVEILRETSPKLEVTGFGEVSLGVPPPRSIQLSLGELNESLGTAFELDEVVRCLGRIELSLAVDKANARLTATVGNARPDLALPCDLIEEVARLAGYDRIPETVPNEPIPARLHEDTITRREAMRDALVRSGLQEILSYSLNGPELEARLFAGHPDAARPKSVPVLNPVTVDRSVLRTSLLPALVATAAMNLRHTPVCRLFELGPVFLGTGEPTALPLEEERVALLIAGGSALPTLHDQKPRAADFFELKALVFELLSSVRLAAGVELVPFAGAPYRPGAAALLQREGRTYGALGAVHPLVLKANDLEGASVFVAELSVAALLADSAARPLFREYDRLPSIELDIAMFVPSATSAGALCAVARRVGGPLLRDVEVFDQFVKPEFGDRKSIAIRLRLNAGERTLEMTEALEVRARIAQTLSTELDAKIRE